MTVYVLIDEKHRPSMVCGSYAIAEAHMMHRFRSDKQKLSILEMGIINELPTSAVYNIPALTPKYPAP
jgi:hypothetical protein